MPEPRHRCPLCAHDRTAVFVDRERVVVHQNLLLQSAAAARALERGRLQMRCCEQCGFVYNACFDPDLMRYGAHYDNAQHFSPAFQAHLDDRVRHLVHARGVRGKRVVEVGCGQGGFVRRLVEPPEWGNTGWGFDPAYAGPARVLDGRLAFQTRYYDGDAASVRADVVVCRHVIEHVAEPLQLLRAVRSALDDSPHAAVFFETPCAAWILEHRVHWDLFYEHCSLFTAESLRAAFEDTGFTVHEVQHVFGGQYLWLEATPARAAAANAGRAPSSLGMRARAFGEHEARLRARWSEQVRELAGRGGVALWGAGAKGVTFANMVDPQARLIDCVVDVNPAKQAHFLPGTGPPIVAPQRLRDAPVAAALALNPNYVDEIRDTLRELGVAAQVVDMMHDEDALTA